MTNKKSASRKPPLRMFEQMNRAIAAKNIKPVIDRTFEFKEAKQAFGMMESAAHFGKLVVKI